jgi:hypothetical protein
MLMLDSTCRWGEVQSWLPGYQGLLQDKGDGPGAMMLALLWKPRLTLVSCHGECSWLAGSLAVPLAELIPFPS